MQVVVNWQGGMSNFAATLDGVDVTSQFFVSYGMAVGKGQQNADVQALSKKLESFLGADEELGKL